MFPGGDEARIADGASPQREMSETTPASARVAELVGEHQGHLVAVLFPERRRITSEECPVGRLRPSHAPGTSPVARACCTSVFNRPTSAAATRLPKRVSR